MPAAILVASSAGPRRCQEFHQQAHILFRIFRWGEFITYDRICHVTVMWPKMNPLGLGIQTQSRMELSYWGEFRILDVFVIGSVKLPLLPTTDGCNSWRARDSFWQGIIHLDSRSRRDDYLTTLPLMAQLAIFYLSWSMAGWCRVPMGFETWL